MATTQNTPPPHRRLSGRSVARSRYVDRGIGEQSNVPLAELAMNHANTPIAESSQRRYGICIKMYRKLLQENNVDIDNKGSDRDRANDPVANACQLLLMRCGPKEDGYEGLSAKATGGAIRSAVISFFRSRGEHGRYEDYPNGSYSGNPGYAPQIGKLKNRLEAAQRLARSHPERRAYQLTHEDVRKINEKHFDDNVMKALAKSPDADLRKLEAACMCAAQFGAVCRSDELRRMTFDCLRFTGDAVDDPVIGVLEITKSRRTQTTYVNVKKGVHYSICGLEKLMAWLAVCDKHGIRSGPVFPEIVGNRLQQGHAIDPSTYRKALRDMGRETGISDALSEHSARRGGAGFLYFVLRIDLWTLFHMHFWETLMELLRYIGIEDLKNSYALLGFTAWGTWRVF
eukprot:Plantae.Rhodophyta-Hildenbrandia_rubra.ctg2863.p1 GENE.Plantae.Rhodophyta-Hildenbrandia_rubra.ctg2863~~Plantae.Rhodophyta-Hildenbrandia_rubra.ctg2863.p1  ORF type:complete len:400 (+),score=35.73 Plantae.Rhodophyta-Hildenbrandia_rubra.ctg2863:217-1416(+)